VARPDWDVVLLDSSHKKGAFLRQVILELKLGHTQVVIERAEHWHPVQGFDVVISRAFSDLASFVQTARHFCHPATILAAMKGVYPDEELTQLGPDTRVRKVAALQIPGLRAARHLVLLQLLAAGDA
jgi:16S rRNA (guanine527-N7)-methyltransferase